MEKTHVTFGEDETLALAECLGLGAFSGAVVALWGGLGMGKTAFVRGFCRGLGIEEGVCSPTFGLVHSYEGRLPVYHFDLYRLSGEEDAIQIGAEEMIYGRGVSLLEWPGCAEGLLPRERLDVFIEPGNAPDERVFTFRWTSQYNTMMEGIAHANSCG